MAAQIEEVKKDHTSTVAKVAKESAKRILGMLEKYDGKRFSRRKIEKILKDFHQQGYIVLKNVVPLELVKKIDELTTQYMTKKDQPQSNYYETKEGTFMVRLYELHEAFCAMLLLQPIAGVMKRIVNRKNYHLIADGLIDGYPSKPGGFGVSDAETEMDTGKVVPRYSLPEGIDRHDPKVKLPVPHAIVAVPLKNVTADSGPALVVPGSHYAGRLPDKRDVAPTFEGKKPVKIICEPGDIYILNSQVWHKEYSETPDTDVVSKKPDAPEKLKVYQYTVGPRHESQRLDAPFWQYSISEKLRKTAEEVDAERPPETVSLKKLLGCHAKGAFG